MAKLKIYKGNEFKVYVADSIDEMICSLMSIKKLRKCSVK